VPAVLAALRPRVAVVDNGMWKGGAAAALDTLHHWPGLESVWQLHLSESDGAENSDESFIANLVDDDKDVADWIKLRASDVAASAWRMDGRDSGRSTADCRVGREGSLSA
jgi:hypothetical protein